MLPLGCRLMSGVGDWLGRNADSLALTVVSIAAGIFFSWYLFIKQKQPKTLDWAILSDQPLTPNGRNVPEAVNVRWMAPIPWVDATTSTRWRTLNAARLIEIRIQNTGKQPLTAADFEDPVTVSIGKGWLIDLVVTNSSHGGTGDLANLDQVDASNTRRFRPRLMNQGDWIDLSLTTEFSKDIGGKDQFTLLELDGQELWLTSDAKLAANLTVGCWIHGETRPMQRRQEILNTPLRRIVWSRLRVALKSSNNLDTALTSGLALTTVAILILLGLRLFG